MNKEFRNKVKKKIAGNILRYRWIHEVLLRLYTLNEPLGVDEFCKKYRLSRLKALCVIKMISKLYGVTLLQQNAALKGEITLYPIKDENFIHELEKLIFHFLQQKESENLFKVIEKSWTQAASKKKTKNDRVDEQKNAEVNIEDFIIKAINQEQLLILQFQKEKIQELLCLPHKILVVENHKILVVEEVTDRCLSYFDLRNILSVREDKSGQVYQSNFSKQHIKDFIDFFRSLGQEEIRVIIKFTSLEKVSFYQIAAHVKNPYLAMNGRGEFVWAATVFDMAPLYQWLEQIGTDAEILDPEEVKKNYAKCMSKKKHGQAA